MMQNNLMKKEDSFQEENEVNIYEIIGVFIKNLKLFILISVIGILLTFLYVGKLILFNKNNTIYIDYTLNYEAINSFVGDKVYYPKDAAEGILLEDKYLELLFENPELKELYEKEVKENRENITNKRDFFNNNEIIETISMKKMAKTKEEQELISPDSYRTTVKVNSKEDVNRKISNAIMQEYLKILNQYYRDNLFKYLAERKQDLEKSLPTLKKQLEENSVFDKEAISTKGIVDNSYFKYHYPVQVSNIDTYYEKYKTLETEYQSIKILFDLGFDKSENFIKYDSSIIIENEKTGNIMKLLGGIFLSLCLATLAIFIKQFLEDYKKNKEKI